MPPPICFVCKVEMRCMQNGVEWWALELQTLVESDLWGCTRCENKVLVGHGEPQKIEDTDLGREPGRVKVFIEKGP